MEIKEYQNISEQENSFWWYVALHELVESYVRRLQKSGKNDILILDAGCGTGGMMHRMQVYGKTEGLDFSPEALKFCTEKGLENVHLTDLNSWDPPAGKYDLIVSLDVLYHQGIGDDEAILHKFHRALKPGGTLILNLPAFDFLRRAHDNFVHGNKRYTRSQLRSKLKQAGFQKNDINYRLPHIALVILLQKLFRKKEANPSETDLKALSSGMNAFLLLINRLENLLIRWRFPAFIGSSVFSVSRK